MSRVVTVILMYHRHKAADLRNFGVYSNGIACITNVISIHSQVELKRTAIWNYMKTPAPVCLLHACEERPATQIHQIFSNNKCYHTNRSQIKSTASSELPDTTTSCVPYHKMFLHAVLISSDTEVR
jgi:hypothetical protein